LDQPRKSRLRSDRFFAIRNKKTQKVTVKSIRKVGDSGHRWVGVFEPWVGAFLRISCRTGDLKTRIPPKREKDLKWFEYKNEEKRVTWEDKRGSQRVFGLGKQRKSSSRGGDWG